MNAAAKFRWQIERAVALPTLLLGLLSAVFFGLVIHLLSVLGQVDEADRRISRAYAASRLLSGMEVGLRDYLVAGAPESLLPYTEARTAFGTTLDELARLVSLDTGQSARLTLIRSAIERSDRYANELIALRSESAWNDRVAGLDVRTLESMDEALRLMAAFQGTEEVQRERRSRAGQSRSWSILAGCSGVAISLGVVLAFASRRQLAELCGAFEAALEALQSQIDRQEREGLNLMSEAMKYYAIFTLDAEGRIKSWNVDAERILGHRADDVLARRVSFLYGDEGAMKEKAMNDLDWASREGRVEDERWMTRKDGFRFKAGVAIVAIRDAGGKLCGFTYVVHEVDG